MFSAKYNKTMKLNHSFLIAAFCAVCSSQAAIVMVGEYHLGEAGSLGANNRPLDSATVGTPSGSQNFANEINGSSALVGTSGVYAPGSTAYLDTSATGDVGWYDGSSGMATLPTDNFAFGIYASAANLGAAQGDVFSLGGGNGAFKISSGPNGWAASAHNVSWISAENGVVGSFTANQWVHLALVRTSGTTTFYINGVAQGTYAGAPVHNSLHLSVDPGGAKYFDGLIDEARIVTFDAADAGAGNINVLNALAIPETSSSLLGAFGSLLLLRRQRFHRGN